MGNFSGFKVISKGIPKGRKFANKNDSIRVSDYGVYLSAKTMRELNAQRIMFASDGSRIAVSASANKRSSYATPKHNGIIASKILAGNLGVPNGQYKYDETVAGWRVYKA